MVKIVSIEGDKFEVDCIGCALQKGIIKSVGECIFETKYFIVNQDFEIPIPGFVVISSKRHITSILDFTIEEEKEFFDLIKKTRSALKEILNIKYVMQFCNESKIISKKNPSHFHYCFLPKDNFESKNLNETMEFAKKNLNTDENIKKVKNSIIQLKNYFVK